VGHAELDLVIGGAQAADAWKKITQPIFKFGLLAQINFAIFTLDHGFHSGVAGPEVGAAKGTDTRDFH
jgi:hypothetical protein